MAAFVHFVDGLAGTTQRAFGLAVRLRERGHSVTIASPVDLSADARAAGIDFCHLAGTAQREAVRAGLARPGGRRLGLRIVARWLRVGRRLRRESLADREIEIVLDDSEPDLVLVDHEFHTAALACRARGVRFVLMSGIFSTMRSASNAPLDTALVPGSDDPAVVDAAWNRTIEGHRSARRAAESGVARFTAWFRPVQLMTSNSKDIAAFARSRGLRLDDQVATDRWLRPFTIDRVATISLTPTALEWADEHPLWRTVGIVPALAAIDRSSDDDRGRLNALIERRAGNESRPLVYASLGTFWSGAAATIDLLVDSLGRLQHVDAVVGLGSLVDPDTIDAPPNVTLLGWAPQTELLAMADLAVIHGGITSIGECLLEGVPMVVASTHTNDQDGTVARAVAAGVAAPVDHRTIDAAELARTIARALDDDDLAGRVRAIAASVRAEVDSDRSITAFEELADPSSDNAQGD